MADTGTASCSGLHPRTGVAGASTLSVPGGMALVAYDGPPPPRWRMLWCPAVADRLPRWWPLWIPAVRRLPLGCLGVHGPHRFQSRLASCRRGKGPLRLVGSSPRMRRSDALVVATRTDEITTHPKDHLHHRVSNLISHVYQKLMRTLLFLILAIHNPSLLVRSSPQLQ